MQIGEYSFPHLYQAEEEQFTRELEWRRVAAERAAEASTEAEARATGSARHASRRVSTLRRLLSHPGGTM
ncbi:hypothetical protein ACFJGV_00860 [Cnuibacter sp. UC19_7]|uniref:hypothetical protein n=1 Tax=Cnuibacter sp. UC19_7 TaxID=3350166 RepID=UPI00367048FA